jgi:hypothetical protein
MANTRHQAPNNGGLRQLKVRPSKIEAGDWLRDLGRYRQVESVDVLTEFAASSTLHSVCFTDGEAADGSTLSIPEAVLVTVWRKV